MVRIRCRLASVWWWVGLAARIPCRGRNRTADARLRVATRRDRIRPAGAPSHRCRNHSLPVAPRSIRIDGVAEAIPVGLTFAAGGVGVIVGADDRRLDLPVGPDEIAEVACTFDVMIMDEESERSLVQEIGSANV